MRSSCHVPVDRLSALPVRSCQSASRSAGSFWRRFSLRSVDRVGVAARPGRPGLRRGRPARAGGGRRRAPAWPRPPRRGRPGGPGRRRRSCRPRRKHDQAAVVEAEVAWSSRQIRLASVADSPSGRLRAQVAGRLAGGGGADHLVAGTASKAAATTLSIVVLPGPATPTTISAPRPDVQIAMPPRWPARPTGGPPSPAPPSPWLRPGRTGAGWPARRRGPAGGDGCRRWRSPGPAPTPGSGPAPGRRPRRPGGPTSGSASARSTSASRSRGPGRRGAGPVATRTWRRQNTLLPGQLAVGSEDLGQDLRGPASRSARRPGRSLAAASIAAARRSAGQPTEASSASPPVDQVGLGSCRPWPCGWCGRPPPGPGRTCRPGGRTRRRSPPPAWSAPPSPRRGHRRSASARASPTAPGRPRSHSPARPRPGRRPPGRPWWRRADAPATTRCRPPSSRPRWSAISTRLASST